MYCLVYRSKANATLDGAELQEILEKSRERNQKKEITGCLLYYNDHFLQYLEGNQIKVLELYDKIRMDERHSDVTLLSHEAIDEREFETWDMAFEYLRNENSQLQYLKLLVGTYLSDEEDTLSPNPTSRKFWNATRLMLQSKRESSWQKL